MNAIKILNSVPKSRIFSGFNSIAARRISSSTSKLKEAKEEKDKDYSLQEILEELNEPELTEDEIMKIRFKARIEDKTYKEFILKEPVPIEYEYDFYMHRLRVYYGKFGKDSKLNPGICWPTKQEIRNIIEDDKIWEPSLEERVKNIEAKRIAKEQERKEIENTVEKNMANNDRWIKEYYDKIEAKENKARQLKLERERLVEEISEYLGYDIDPRDPRFKEAVEQRDKDKKKALKVKKQQESYEKMLDKLRKIAESQ